MSWELYQKDGLNKEIILDFGDYVFTLEDVSENLNCSQIVNPTEDVALGTVGKMQLTYQLNNLYQLIPDEAITEKIFTYKAGLDVGRSSKKELYKQIRNDMLIIAHDKVYAASSKAPFLTVWDLSGNLLEIPEQPPQAVESLFNVNGKLYCGHNNPPYLTAYNALESNIVKLKTPSLNAFQEAKIANFNKLHAAFSVDKNFIKRYKKDEIVQLINGAIQTTLLDYEETLFEFFDIGTFSAKESERKDDISINVTAYDQMSKLDIVVDDWNNAIVYPITAGNMLKSLCDHIKIPLATPTFLNSDFRIQENYTAVGVTGTQIVQWIAQLAASFAVANEKGELCIRWYEDRGYTINEKSYTDVTIAGYETAPIDKVQIRVTENDIGVSVPENDETKTNALVIENNPLMYALTPEELLPAAKNIYNAVVHFAYYPFRIRTIWGDPRRRAGDIVTIKTLKGQMVKSPIMQCSTSGIRALKGDYLASGGKTRNTQVDVTAQQFRQVRGSIHEVKNTIQEFQSTFTEYQKTTDGTLNTHQTEIKQNANDILLRAKTETVDGIDGRLSTAETSIKANANEIALRATTDTVNNIGKRLTTAESSITINAKAITSKVEQQSYDNNNTAVNNRFTEIVQKVDGVTTTVAGPGGTSVTSLKPESVQFSFNDIAGENGAKINADGIEILKNGQRDMFLGDGEMRVVHDGQRLGNIGKSRYEGYNIHGLSMEIDKGGYIGFGVWEKPTDKEAQVWMAIENNSKQPFKGIGIYKYAQFTKDVDINGSLYVGGFSLQVENELWCDDINGEYAIFKKRVDSPEFKVIRESKTRSAPISLSVVSSFNDIVEASGSAQIKNGICEISLKLNITYDKYQVFITPIGGNAHVSKKEKTKFIVEGDDIEFDYLIRYETIETSAYSAPEPIKARKTSTKTFAPDLVMKDGVIYEKDKYEELKGAGENEV